jgi:hypothetical protein
MNDEIINEINEIYLQEYEEIKDISNNCLLYLDTNSSLLFNNFY